MFDCNAFEHCVRGEGLTNLQIGRFVKDWSLGQCWWWSAAHKHTQNSLLFEHQI